MRTSHLSAQGLQAPRVDPPRTPSVGPVPSPLSTSATLATFQAGEPSLLARGLSAAPPAYNTLPLVWCLFVPISRSILGSGWHFSRAVPRLLVQLPDQGLPLMRLSAA